MLAQAHEKIIRARRRRRLGILCRPVRSLLDSCIAIEKHPSCLHHRQQRQKQRYQLMASVSSRRNACFTRQRALHQPAGVETRAPCLEDRRLAEQTYRFALRTVVCFCETLPLLHHAGTFFFLLEPTLLKDNHAWAKWPNLRTCSFCIVIEKSPLRVNKVRRIFLAPAVCSSRPLQQVEHQSITNAVKHTHSERPAKKTNAF